MKLNGLFLYNKFKQHKKCTIRCILFTYFQRCLDYLILKFYIFTIIKRNMKIIYPNNKLEIYANSIVIK